jgi:hypothetical protein
MKIRISGNSIRLRLSQSEVRVFTETGEVLEHVRFGASPSDVLTYALKRTDAAEMSASFINNRITVLVPAEQGDTWAYAEQEVGMEHLFRHTPGEGGSLRILVEKDFKCLAERPAEDENDNFPNPNLSC